MEHISYKTQIEIVTFQGREIPLENLTPHPLPGAGGGEAPGVGAAALRGVPQVPAEGNACLVIFSDRD